jgi:hypothetical protein
MRTDGFFLDDRQERAAAVIAHLEAQVLEAEQEAVDGTDSTRNVEDDG